MTILVYGAGDDFLKQAGKAIRDQRRVNYLPEEFSTCYLTPISIGAAVVAEEIRAKL